ncbi:MAG: LLM class flavin-dependent oxidoreductase [Chloroflexi bacterium]|nr:LLM class flavin-dependent oxidoreductase [Chloroflexota bacterium]
MTLTIGVLHTWHGTDPQEREEFLRFGRQAEELGFARLWVGDSPMIWQDVYVALTVLAMNTSRIGLGTGVTHPNVRHPAVTASAIGTLNGVSGGRAVLGIGPGDSAHGTIGIKPADAASMKAAIQLIRDLNEGKEVEYGDRTLRLLWAREHVPVYWATARRSCLAMAGEVADGVILPSPVDADILGRQVAVVREAAANAGRNPADVKICLWTNCYVGDDPQELERARFETRATATSRLRHSRWWLPEELRERAIQIRRQYDYYQHAQYQAEQYALTPEHVVEMMTIIGPREQCRAKLRLCEEAGVDELMLGVGHFHNRFAVLEKLGREILPLYQ